MANFNSSDVKQSRWREGEHFVWATGAALALTLLMALTLIVTVMYNGLGMFWPRNLVALTMTDGTKYLGEITQEEEAKGADPARLQLKIANRDIYGLDFTWVDAVNIQDREIPTDAVVLERTSYGNFHGYLKSLAVAPNETGDALWNSFGNAWKDVLVRAEKLEEIDASLKALGRRSEKLRTREFEALTADPNADLSALDPEKAEHTAEFARLENEKTTLSTELESVTATFLDASGTEKAIPLVQIVRYYKPNQISFTEKCRFYVSKTRELLFDNPREANTEGGLFPAIFGTVTLIFLMSIFSFPLGLLAGIYLREYATDGFMVRAVRIAVNNLAGIPSIVYGIFGLGFFVYGIGGAIDALFFREQLPNATFGTGGILWSSLTLGLLTVPVVIVATEEALGAIPRGIRESSLALGATKFQTLVRLLLPMASPGIMTGFILAMARAAGEVAPLIITGVVKSAPSLPLDSTWPFIHFERKFMHLGFHIYDIGSQSPNVEAAKPMVFITTLLLVIIVLCMSSIAIYLRNKMKKRYTIGSI